MRRSGLCPLYPSPSLCSPLPCVHTMASVASRLTPPHPTCPQGPAPCPSALPLAGGPHAPSTPVTLVVSLEYFSPDSPQAAGGCSAGAASVSHSPCPSLPQANVEHMTEKMKTDIQRGLVLRWGCRGDWAGLEEGVCLSHGGPPECRLCVGAARGQPCRMSLEGPWQGAVGSASPRGLWLGHCGAQCWGQLPTLFPGTRSAMSTTPQTSCITCTPLRGRAFSTAGPTSWATYSRYRVGASVAGPKGPRRVWWGEGPALCA